MSNKQKMFIEVVFGLTGMAIIWYSTSWLVALGLFLCLFANNAGQSKQ